MNEFLYFLISTLILTGLLIYQQIYWSRLTSNLVDKLMSRNYAEYQQAVKLTQDGPKKSQPQELKEDLRYLEGSFQL